MTDGIRHPAFKGWRLHTLMEPPLVIFLFTEAITGSVLTDLLIYRSCQKMLGAQNSECDVLHTNSSSDNAMNLEALVQPHASYILMCKSVIDSLIPAFLSFFLGSWSDRYGRKPLLVVGYFGMAISGLLFSILCTMDIDPWFFLIASVPTAFTGGFYVIIATTFCYITDIRKEADRVLHLTLIQLALAAGIFFGSLAGRVMYENFSYTAIFGAASAGSAVSALYVLFLVPESVECNVQISWCSLFDVSLVKDTIAICTKKRDGYDRAIIWCCICCLSINMLVFSGENSVGFLFASAKLGWNVKNYSLFTAASVLIMIIGTFAGVKLAKFLIDQSMADMSIAIFAGASAFAGSMSKSFATRPWHFYLSSTLSVIGPLSSPVIRTALSRSVRPQDVGKVFLLSTSMEAVMQLSSNPLFTLVYTLNMSLYPAPVYLLSAGFHAIGIIMAIYIDLRLSKSRTIPDTEIFHEATALRSNLR